MDKKFVYPASKKQEMYRHLTRENKLTRSNYYGLYYDIDFDSAPGDICEELKLDRFKGYSPKDKGLDLFGRSGGINLCDSSIVLMKEHPGGPRLSVYDRGFQSELGPVAFEPIAYGVGVFRDAITRQTGYAALLGIEAFPKVQSKYEKSKLVLVKLPDLDEEEKKGTPWLVDKTVYESTNYIYGDSYGELEQLIKRRKDLRFLNTYVSELKKAAKLTPRLIDYDLVPIKGTHKERYEMYKKRYKMINKRKIFLPRGISFTFDGIAIPWLNNHINRRDALWTKPPEDRVELIERADYLLKDTYIDNNPDLVVTDYNYMCLMEDNDLNDDRTPPIAS